MKAEQYLHQSVCHYLKTQYPFVIFTSEPSGLYVTPGQARTLKSMRSCAGLPDLWILQPSAHYYGLFLELKATNIYKKNGKLKKNEHVEMQANVLHMLRSLGYWANFAVGMDEAVSCIDNYMANKLFTT